MELAEISKANIERLGDDKGKFIEDILHELAISETTLNPWKNTLVTYYELYKMYQRTKHYDGLAQLFIPEIIRAVETIVSQLYKYIFGSDPWYEYEGRTSDDEASAQAETHLVNWQMDEGNFKMRVQDSLRQLAITGLTVRKMVWDFEQVNRTRNVLKVETILDSLTGNPKGKKKSLRSIDELETTKDHWVLEEVNLLGFHISDTSTPYYDIRKADWIGEEYELPKHTVKEKIKKGWFADNFIDQIEEETLDQASTAQRLKDNLKLTSGYKAGDNRKGILLFERWGLLKAKYVYTPEELKEKDLDSDDMIETVMVLANKRYLLKLEANPYWHGQKPYLSCPYVPQEDEFAGIGVCKIGGTLQEELNDTRNQTMDNKTLILMNMWLKDRASGIKNQDLRIRPNGVIPTNNIAGLQPLRPPVLTGIGVNIEGVVKNDLRESVGAPSNLQGIAQSGVSTATESTQINTQALGRLQMTAQLYAELILKPMLVMIEYLNYQFYDREKVIGIVGPEGVSFQKMSPEDIVGYKNVVIKLSTDIDENPGVKRQQALQFLTIVQQLPPQMLQMHWKLLDKIYKMFFPKGHSLEDLYPVPPDQEELIDPSDENDVMLMGHFVDVKQGDDDKEHIQVHQKEFDTLKYSLSPIAMKLYTNHILKHHQQMAQKLKAQAQAVEMQNMAAMAGASGKSKSNGNGQGINPGQVAGASAFTQPSSVSAGSLNQNLGA